MHEMLVEQVWRLFNDCGADDFISHSHQASKMTALAFSRKDEYEADERGVSYLQSAGISPQGLISFFDKLIKLEYPNGKAAHAEATHVSWFSTHPGTEERIAALKQKFKI